MRILLVTVDAALRDRVRAALADLPDVDRVERVDRPEHALARLDAGEVPDVIVADADTHPTGGFSLGRELRLRRADGRDVPPLLTLLAREQDRYLARWSGADAHVLKPPDPLDLADAVRALAAGESVGALPGYQGPATALGAGGAGGVAEAGALPAGPAGAEEADEIRTG